jgi:hypothetical protein
MNKMYYWLNKLALVWITIFGIGCSSAALKNEYHKSGPDTTYQGPSEASSKYIEIHKAVPTATAHLEPASQPSHRTYVIEKVNGKVVITIKG